jgi:hypothetical protein
MSSAPIRVIHVDGAHNNLSGNAAWASVVFLQPKTKATTTTLSTQSTEISESAAIEGVQKKTQYWTKNFVAIDAVPQHRSLLFSDLELEEITLPKTKRKWVVARVKLNGEHSKQEVNSAELVALLMALRIWKHWFTINRENSNSINNSNTLTTTTQPQYQIDTICSDSQVVFQAWSKNHVAAATRAAMGAQKIAFVEECSRLRQEFEEAGGSVLKIDGSVNLADPETHRDKWQPRQTLDSSAHKGKGKRKNESISSNITNNNTNNDNTRSNGNSDNINNDIVQREGAQKPKVKRQKKSQ